MKFKLLLSLVGLFTAANAAEPPTYDENMASAREAFAAQDWNELAARLDAAQLFRPYSQYIMKNRILAHEMKGDRARALEIIAGLAGRGLSMELSGHEAFEAVKNDPAFTEIATRMEKNMTPAGRNIVEAGGGPVGLPEAITGAQEGGRLFIGSVRSGRISNITADGPPLCAQGGVFDIEVRGNTLWAAVNNQLAYEKAGEQPAFASVAAFDLDMGAQVREIRLGNEDSLIGDIEITSDGTIYASDSITPRIVRVDPGDDDHATSFASPRFANLQGIALDEAAGRLYIADYLTGLYYMDLETGEATLLRNDADAHLGGVDGLYLYDGDLVGIQNGTTPHRIVRMKLTKDRLGVKKFKVLAQNLPEWNEPTHGVVDGDKFLYIATSNWPSYDANNGWSAREDNPPQPLRIMGLDLD